MAFMGYHRTSLPAGHENQKPKTIIFGFSLDRAKIQDSKTHPFKLDSISFSVAFSVFQSIIPNPYT